MTGAKDKRESRKQKADKPGKSQPSTGKKLRVAESNGNDARLGSKRRKAKPDGEDFKEKEGSKVTSSKKTQDDSKSELPVESPAEIADLEKDAQVWILNPKWCHFCPWNVKALD